jgi:hypothetical protein
MFCFLLSDWTLFHAVAPKVVNRVTQFWASGRAVSFIFAAHQPEEEKTILALIHEIDSVLICNITGSRCIRK